MWAWNENKNVENEKKKQEQKTAIDYLLKCFGYVLTRNKGNPEGIQKGCKVIPNHAFGDHSSCGLCVSPKKVQKAIGTSHYLMARIFAERT